MNCLLKASWIDADGAVSLFADDQFGESVVLFGWIDHLFAVDEEHEVGILFDGTGFSQVRELRPAMLSGPGFDGAAELRNGDDRDAKFFGDSL